MPPGSRRILDELATLGRDILDRQMRPNLRPEDDGEFIAIDVETGDHEMDIDDYAAVAPGAMDIRDRSRGRKVSQPAHKCSSEKKVRR
jgi:hypothetical protein